MRPALLCEILRDVQGRIDGATHADRIPESRRHHTDDGVRSSIKLDGLANRGILFAEGLFPQLIAQNRHIVLPGLVFSLGKCAPQQRLHAKDIEEAVGCGDVRQTHWAGWALKVGAAM